MMWKFIKKIFGKSEPDEEDIILEQRHKEVAARIAAKEKRLAELKAEIAQQQQIIQSYDKAIKSSEN
ncbi:MAG: hypothetical protein WA919_03590 [Coleofasciculaceae cyanobacterium]